MKDFIADCARLGIPVQVDGIEDYLHDESRFQGHAFGVVRIRKERDVIDILALANEWRVPLTVVSGKTSLTGAAAPLGGVVLDLKGLNAIDPDDPAAVQPGVILSEYKSHIQASGFFYPPDPTSEDSCTIGGNVACNASGALSYSYGPTRDYILGLKVALPTGRVLEIERGDVISREGLFRVPAEAMYGPDKTEIVVPVPQTGAPPWHFCKSAAGLFSADPMDLVDLFIGSEGILGVVLRIKTRLLQRRPPFFALMLYIPTRELTVRTVTLLDQFKSFFRDRDDSLRAVIENVVTELDSEAQPLSLARFRAISPACMEWFGTSVSTLVSAEMGSKLSRSYGCLYVEQEYEEGADPIGVASQWAGLIDLLNCSRGSNDIPIEAEVAIDHGQIRRLKDERRHVPEKLNESIRPGMVKIGTDFAVPMPSLEKLLELYDDLLPKGKSFVFGHIGNAHLHSNMLPEDAEEAAEFRSIYRKLAQEICKLGGSVSGEHGIGKLKHEALEMMIGKHGIEEIRKTKRTLDPRGILNMHNMIAID